MKTAFLVFWQDVISGGLDGGVFQRDHIVCLTEKARDREMQRMLDSHITELKADMDGEFQDPDWTWEPYVSARTGDEEGPHFTEVKIVD